MRRKTTNLKKCENINLSFSSKRRAMRRKKQPKKKSVKNQPEKGHATKKNG